MNLDNLATIFDAAVDRSKSTNREDLPDAAHRRAGIRAVVAALRDEMVAHFKAHYTLDEGEIHTLVAAEAVGLIDDILGDAGNEKAAGVIAQEVVGAGLSPASGQAPAADPCPHCNGEGCTPQLDRRGNVYPEPCQACETTGKVLKPANPSPEVCEWSVSRDPDGEGHYETKCGNGWMMAVSPPPARDGYNFCPSCGKPITFKEATK